MVTKRTGDPAHAEHGMETSPVGLGHAVSRELGELGAAILSLIQAHSAGRSSPGHRCAWRGGPARLRPTLGLVRPRLQSGGQKGARGRWTKWREGCRVMEGRGCLPWHPSILAYTFKGHAYSMTLLPRRSPSCPTPPQPAPRPPASRAVGAHHGGRFGASPAHRGTTVPGTPCGHRQDRGSPHRMVEAAEKAPSAPLCPHPPYKAKGAPLANPVINLQAALIASLMKGWGKPCQWV